MNSWRLLLLAVVVVVQPIGSFTESNLIDGRECCERTEDVRFYGTGRHTLDGKREDRRSTDEHRLKLLDESRGWRYERSLSHSEKNERRLSLESKSSRYPRDQTFSRATSRKIREDLSRSRDEFRSSVGQVKRDSRESRSRDAVGTTRSVRLSRDARDTRSIRHSRDSVSRLQIHNSRDLENRQVSGRETVDSYREREVVVRSGSRHDARLIGTRSDSRIQLEDNKDRRAFDRNTQANRENQRFSNARDSEIQARMSNGRNDREVRAVRAELRRQRDIEFRARMITDNLDTAKILDSRDDSKRVIRNRMDTRINDRLESLRHGRDENRSFMDTLRNTEERRVSLSSQRIEGETRDARLTRHSERNMRDERSSINRDKTFDIRMPQRENRRATVSTDRTTSLLSKQRNGNNKIRDSRHRRVVARRDNRESLDGRRQQRDNSRQWSAKLTRDHRETDRTEESRRVIDGSEERMHERYSSSRNQQSRENGSPDVRRKILEQGIERAISINRRAERRQDRVREIRATRSVEDVRGGRRTTNNRDEHQQTRKQERTNETRMNRDAVSTQMLEARLPTTENNPIDRTARKRYVVRRTDERDTTERNVVRATRNVESPQRLASRRFENIRLERQLRSREELTDNERREIRRDDTRFDRRRSSERVQAERRQNNHHARNEMSRNREVRIDERLDSRRERDVFSRGSERVLAERRQDNREATQEKIARNLNDVRAEKIITERQEESRDRHLRDVRGEARIVEAERRQGNRIAKDSRYVSDERNLETRRMLTRAQDNRDARIVRDETMGQRGDTRSMNTLQRNSRVTERINERESRPETDSRRVSRVEMRSNIVRIETSRFPLKDERILKHQGGSRNVDTTSDFVETEEPVGNWKLALYTLQGIYLCGLLVQMLTENGSKTKKRSFNWRSSHKDLIKVD